MKNVIVTGGSRGIGKCLVENLAKDGYNVLLNYNKSEKQARKIQNDLKEEGIIVEEEKIEEIIEDNIYGGIISKEVDDIINKEILKEEEELKDKEY